VSWGRKAGYELVELTGCSALGLIFTARKLTLFNQLVTLKTFSALSRVSEERLQQFRSQAEVAARLHHPGIESVYDFGQYQGRHYCAVEYVEGGRLTDRFLGTPQPEQQAAPLIQALAEAVQYAHEQGITHGNLRPNNVLLTRDGKPKITGFGLPRLLRRERDLSSYMAPEQVRAKSEEIGPHTDVYALGAMLYEQLTGEPPCLGADIEETVRLIQDTDPTPAGSMRPGVAPVLEQVCLRCLRKNPNERYHSARELASDLRR
jgi:serine/threonine-protein kinase